MDSRLWKVAHIETEQSKMNSIRAIQPLTRAAPAVARRTLTPATRRFVNIETGPVIYSSHAKAVGARSGHVVGDDLTVDLTMPKAVGGPGEKGKTNPEELFAAGYSACFQSAMNASAASMGVKIPTEPDASVVDCTVHLIGSLKELDMGIRVDMNVSVKGMERAQLEKVLEKTKEVCPYSRATKGNVITNVNIV